MAERSPDQQQKPLAPAAHWIASDEESLSMELKEKKKVQQRKCMIQCCGCITCLLLVLVVILLVLIFTIFHVKSPVIKMNSITIENLQLENGTLRSGVNITLLADVSVKNNNYATFKFDNATTIVYYHDATIGEGMTPSGQAKKRKTLKMNLTVDIIPDMLLAVPGLSRDVSSGSLNFSSFTRISGRVKVFKTVHKLVVVNCTMTVDVTRQAIKNQNCDRHVTF